MRFALFILAFLTLICQMKSVLSQVRSVAIFDVPTVTLNNGRLVKRVINGLWQTAGDSWGVDPNSAATVEALAGKRLQFISTRLPSSHLHAIVSLSLSLSLEL
jgi:hypothetical protein